MRKLEPLERDAVELGEPLERAQARGARIYAELVGWKVNSDAADFVLPLSERQNECMVLRRALAAAGSAVDYGSFAGTGLRGHMEINRRLGDPDYPATALVDGWLRKNLAE